MKYLLKLFLTQFRNGRWGFSTTKGKRVVNNSVFSGTLSSFSSQLGAPINASTSPVAGVNAYLFLDDEYQEADVIAELKETFEDGCYMYCTVDGKEFIPTSDEPLTLADVKAANLLDDVAKPFSASRVTKELSKHSVAS